MDTSDITRASPEPTRSAEDSIASADAGEFSTSATLPSPSSSKIQGSRSASPGIGGLAPASRARNVVQRARNAKVWILLVSCILVCCIMIYGMARRLQSLEIHHPIAKSKNVKDLFPRYVPQAKLPKSKAKEYFAKKKAAHKNDPRYVLVDTTSGSLVDQMVSAVDAYIQAQKHKMVLVLNPMFTPGGRTAVRSVANPNDYLYMFQNGFNRSLLESPTLTMKEFLDTRDGVRFTGANAEELPFFYHRPEDLEGTAKFYNRRATKDWEFKVVPFSPSGMFAGINKNCAHTEPAFVHALSLVRPIDAIQNSVAQFFGTVPKPVIVLQALQLTGDDPDTFFDFIAVQYDAKLERLRHWRNGTIYVIGDRSPKNKNNVQALIRFLETRWNVTTDVFVDPSAIHNIGDILQTSWMSGEIKKHNNEQEDALHNYYSLAIAELWIAANCNFYIGREYSSYSRFISVYREALSKKPENVWLF